MLYILVYVLTRVSCVLLSLLLFAGIHNWRLHRLLGYHSELCTKCRSHIGTPKLRIYSFSLQQEKAPAICQTFARKDLLVPFAVASTVSEFKFSCDLFSLLYNFSMYIPSCNC